MNIRDWEMPESMKARIAAVRSAMRTCNTPEELANCLRETHLMADNLEIMLTGKRGIHLACAQADMRILQLEAELEAARREISDAADDALEHDTLTE